jgi:hypothetical protein
MLQVGWDLSVRKQKVYRGFCAKTEGLNLFKP